MASSFVEQIHVVIAAIQRLGPKTVLDVGKGFGKYGFLIHEFAGIPMDRELDPTLLLREQSEIVIDAVEIQERYLFPHLEHLYREVVVGDITLIYTGLKDYELVLMADVVEHLEKNAALRVVQHFVARGSVVLITSPRAFFHQNVYKSEWETHQSLWTPKDFKWAPYRDWQSVGAGRVYIVSGTAVPVKGFGRGPVKRARRFARLFRDALR